MSLVVSLMIASAASGPWYERSTCVDAAQAVMSVDFEGARAKLAKLDRGDVEDKACAVWTRAMLAETALAVGGRQPQLLEARRKSLYAMFSFAKRYRKTPHLADLAIEARVRRVRVLLDDGERKRALDETRGAVKMLERREGANNATLDYTRGVVNMALSQSGWGMRLLLQVAGFSGDANLGRTSLERLAQGKSVYWSDAQYVRHFFTVESDAKDTNAAAMMKRLVDAFPDNPQLTYEYATDLFVAGDCPATLATVTNLNARIDSDPGLWSNDMRAKLYWLGGRCAADVGQRELAMRWAKRADAQGSKMMSDRIEDLLDQL
ncbi:MAG: hypothetical protein RMA76_16890 [Deltaproteobacteria bacterium]|jgi:hypothetical protein